MNDWFLYILIFICGSAAGVQLSDRVFKKKEIIEEKKEEIAMASNTDHHQLLWEMKKLETLYEHAQKLDIKTYGMNNILKSIKLELELAEREAFQAIGKEAYMKLKEDYNKKKRTLDMKTKTEARAKPEEKKSSNEDKFKKSLNKVMEKYKNALQRLSKR